MKQRWIKLLCISVKDIDERDTDGKCYNISIIFHSFFLRFAVFARFQSMLLQLFHLCNFSR